MNIDEAKARVAEMLPRWRAGQTSSDTAAEEAACVTEALERCQTDLLCSACDGTIVANNTRMFLAEVVELYRIALRPGGVPCALGNLAAVVRLCAALGETNNGLRRQLLSAWVAARSPSEAREDAMNCSVGLLGAWTQRSGELLCAAQPSKSQMGMNTAALQSLLMLCDDLYVYAGVLGGLGGQGTHQRALLDVCLLLYNEVLPRVILVQQGRGRTHGAAWARLHMSSRRVVKAVWLLLSLGSKDDPTRPARVSSVVNHLLQAAEAESSSNISGGDSEVPARRLEKHVHRFRDTVMGRGGWALLPHLGADQGGLAARDVWLVFAERLRSLLLETVCDGHDNEDDRQRVEYLMTCFAGGNIECTHGNSTTGSSLLLYTLQEQLASSGGAGGNSRTSGEPFRATHSGQELASGEAAGGGSEEGSEGFSGMTALFPDCGEVFLRACLRAFDGSVERAVDALLTDNLPPDIAGMDRKMKAAWIGKAATDNTLHVSTSRKEGLNSGAATFVPALSSAEKKAMQARNKAYEANVEEDARVLASEYADDYDDQYDDPGELSHVQMSAGGSGDGAGAGRATGRDQGPAQGGEPGAQRSSQRAGKATTVGPTTLSIKREKKAAAKSVSGTVTGGSLRGVGSAGVEHIMRYNNLLRNEEAEASYWESMKNTNVKKEKTRFEAELAGKGPVEATVSTVVQSVQRQGGGGPGAKDSLATDKKPAPTNKKPPAGGKKTEAPSAGKVAGASEPSEGGKGNKTKFSSRKYDKHHQKDRSSRKFLV